jgi:hypothetical protein
LDGASALLRFGLGSIVPESSQWSNSSRQQRPLAGVRLLPALLVAQQAEIVDLDGPMLLASDRVPGLRYDGGTIYPAGPNLWG